MAGVALSAPQARFAWQAWHFLYHHRGQRKLGDEVGLMWRRGLLRGRRGAFGTSLSICVAGVVLSVQFFDISTSKSGPELTCFVHFHLKMCFSPQRRAIFQHLNFKKWSDNVVFCTFSLDDALLATAPCNF